ncbi:MAG: type transport system permease protein [Acidobacteriota bacterium]|jgi:ABC-2 type transport system permease protein|nr:type transport system permease protein [Acidobacteriota bacterium]
MQLDNIKIVAKREYLQRIRSKGFWIGTVIFPFFAVAMTVLPSLLMARSKTSQTIVVLDDTGRVANQLNAEQPKATPLDRGGQMRMAKVEFIRETVRPDRKAQEDDLDRRVVGKQIDAWIRITLGALTGDPVEYHGRSTSNFMTQEVLEDRLTEAVRRVRLADAGYDPDKVGELSANVDLRTIRVSKEGSRAEGGVGGFLFAYILFFMLFLSLLIWGQQVMNGILEEKGSRAVEVIISTVKPFQLMMGKLSGICLVGLTQFAIWLTTMVVLSAPGIVGSLGRMPDDFKLPTLSPLAALQFLLFFVLGFFVYASFYAALGAAFNSLQEAQQVAGTMGILFAIPAMLMPMIINAPSSTLSTVTSLIPLFSPVLMPMRIVTETPPLWQIAAAYVLTFGFLVLMVWLCGRIYRIGILMYGKKPTIPELLRWVRYS